MFERLRELREDHDLSQTDIAAYLGCSQSVYSRYESGERILPVDVLIKLAKYYSVSTDYLLGLTNIPEPYPLTRK
ncbi:MAG: helix-turn-helix transcriptional regulator [Peptococcaceae bacterium]|nr:helix-turn-helix transcriptional regulator [Peptococcaceae bacterium]MBQ3508476.1 helix-turn-helix transcriptional regulator [Peptococcaceae bacterium]